MYAPLGVVEGTMTLRQAGLQGYAMLDGHESTHHGVSAPSLSLHRLLPPPTSPWHIQYGMSEKHGAHRDTTYGIERQGFNVRHAIAELAAYQSENPDFAAGVGIWMTIGFVLTLLGTLIFLFSEIKAVLVCRDQV